MAAITKEFDEIARSVDIIRNASRPVYVTLRCNTEEEAEALRQEFEADWKGAVRKYNVDVEVK